MPINKQKRNCGWQPTGATPAQLIPVWCHCIPACGLSGVD